MFEEEGKKTTPNASHETYRGRFGMGHAFRRKNRDMAMTKKYYESNPPQVGDKVVVIKTASHSEMYPPEFYEIEAITSRGRIVVEHRDAKYGLAGKSFYKSGQNCMKPKGQIWLIPEALYEEDYISKEDAMAHKKNQYEGKSRREVQRLSEQNMLDHAHNRGQAKWESLPEDVKQQKIARHLLKSLDGRNTDD
jgi:hypothetical protein